MTPEEMRQANERLADERLPNHPERLAGRRHISREELAAELDARGIEHNLHDPG